MATPQLKNGYTRISNELLEAFVRAELSGQEFRCVLCVMRLTYGWGRKSEKISLIQIGKATGISKSRVSELLSSLIQKKILTVREKSNGKTRELAINKDYSQWKTVRKNLNRSGKVEPTVQEKSNPYCPESLDCQGFAESERNILKKYIKENNNNTKADKANFDLVVADNEFISKLQSIFPSVDIQTEIQNMRSWLLVNPPRKDYYRFIQRWIVNAKTKNSQPYQNNDHFEKILKEVRGNKFVGLNDKDYTQGLEGFR